MLIGMMKITIPYHQNRTLRDQVLEHTRSCVVARGAATTMPCALPIAPRSIRLATATISVFVAFSDSFQAGFSLYAFLNLCFYALPEGQRAIFFMKMLN